jgi:hypothetical protein
VARREDTTGRCAMTASEFGRYLDSCGDLLLLTGKHGTLPVQYIQDPVVFTIV